MQLQALEASGKLTPASGIGPGRSGATARLLLGLVFAAWMAVAVAGGAAAHTGGPGWNALPGSADGAPEEGPANPEGCDPADPQKSCSCDSCGCEADGPDSAGASAGAEHGQTTCTESGAMGAHVQVANGQESFSRVDLVVNGVFPIVLERRYDSQSTFDSPLGYGWGFTLDYRIFEYADGSVVLRMGSGTRKKFNLVGPNQFDAGDATFATLSRDGEGKYHVTYPRGRVLHFKSTGLLESIENSEGNKLVFAYEGGDPPQKYPLTGTSPFAIDPSVPMTVASQYRISTIEEVLLDSDATGRKLEFSYCQSGRLDYVQVKSTGVLDTDLPRVKYLHEPTGTVACVSSPDGNLYFADVPSGAGEWIRERYQYADPNDSHNVTHRQYGPNMVEYVNQYDDRDRVVAESWGDSLDPTTLTMTFAYDWPAAGTKSTTVTRNVYSPTSQSTDVATETYYYTDGGITTKIVDSEKGEWHYLASNGQGGFVPRETLVDRLVVYERVDTTLVVKKTVDYGYDVDSRRDSRISIAPSTGHQTTETWVYEQGWLKSRRTTDSSPSAPTFGTDYDFDRDLATGRIIGVKQITELDGGTNEVTTIERGANNQVTKITPPAVDPVDDFVVVREYYATPGPSHGLLARTYAATDAAPPASPTPLPSLEREYQYDARGFVSRVEDKKVNATQITRDWLGRARSIALPNTDVISLTYSAPNVGLANPDSAGPGHYLTRVDWTPVDANELAQATRRIVNALGYPVSITRRYEDQSNEVWQELWSFGYDSDGNRERSTIDGDTWLRRFDKRGRVLAVEDPGQVETLFTYDALGRLGSRQGGRGGLVEYVYDEMDRPTLVRETSALNSDTLDTSFTYDPVGNVLTVTDPRQQTTTYQYDLLSRLDTVTRPAVGGPSPVTDYDYDDRGRLTKITNARLQEIDYTYYPWGGLQTETHAVDGRVISYTYDGNANPLTVSDSSIDTGTDPLYTFTYDSLDRPTGTTAHYLGRPNPQTLQSAYTIRGQRKRLSLHDGLVPSQANELLADSWSYDHRARLASIVVGGGGTIALTHYPDDTLDTVTHASGVTSKRTYHPYGPVASIDVTHAATELLHRSYVYDADRLVDWVSERIVGLDVEPTRTEDYDYAHDGFGRLDGVLYPSQPGLPGSESFTYDAAGNRNPSAHTYDAQNQLTATPTIALLCYDADGNLVKKIASGDCTTGTALETFTFDTTNRLVGHTGAGGTSSYVYDPFGRRIEKTVNGTPARYQWSGDRLYAEYDGSGSLQVRYVYGEGHAPLAVGYGPVGTQTLHAVHSDHLDTPRLLTDATGTAVWRADYEAYGTAHVQSGLPSGQAFNVRFPGQYEDAETGLHYNWFRYYDPGIGRYLSPEPVGQFGILARTRVAPRVPGSIVPAGAIGSAHLYNYSLNSPQNFIDPTGAWVLQAAGAALGGGAAAYAGYDAYQRGSVSGFEYAQQIAFGAGTGALGAYAGGVLGATAYGAASGAANNLLGQTLAGDPCAGLDYGAAGEAAAFGAAGGFVAAAGQAVGGAFVNVGSDIVGAGASSYGNVGGVVGSAVGTAVGAQGP